MLPYAHPRCLNPGCAARRRCAAEHRGSKVTSPRSGFRRSTGSAAASSPRPGTWTRSSRQLELDKLFTRTWLMVCRGEEREISGSAATSSTSSAPAPSWSSAMPRTRSGRITTPAGTAVPGWGGGLRPRRHVHLPVPRLALEPERIRQAHPRPGGVRTRSRPSNWSLISVRCDTWGGFVFINMDPAAEPLLDYLEPCPAVLRAVPVREHAGDVVEERPAGTVQLEDRP